MAVYKYNDVESALLKKGFEQKPGDHKVFVYYYKGKRSKIRTKTSHNKQDIGDSLISCMKKQLHLSKKDFSRLIECPMKQEEYEVKMKEQGILKR